MTQFPPSHFWSDENDGSCAYCGAPQTDDHEIDHIVPTSLGGSGYADNCAIACRQCNELKSNNLGWKTLDGRVGCYRDGRPGDCGGPPSADDGAVGIAKWLMSEIEAAAFIAIVAILVATAMM